MLYKWFFLVARAAGSLVSGDLVSGILFKIQTRLKPGCSQPHKTIAS